MGRKSLSVFKLLYSIRATIVLYNQICMQLSNSGIRVSLNFLAFPPVVSSHMMAALISANGGEQLALQRHTGNVCVPAMKESSQAPVLTIV